MLSLLDLQELLVSGLLVHDLTLGWPFSLLNQHSRAVVVSAVDFRPRHLDCGHMRSTWGVRTASETAARCWCRKCPTARYGRPMPPEKLVAEAPEIGTEYAGRRPVEDSEPEPSPAPRSKSTLQTRCVLSLCIIRKALQGAQDIGFGAGAYECC